MTALWLESAATSFEPPADDVFEKLGFTPNPGPQSRFLALPDENLDVLFGGSAGGSKTVSLLLYVLRSCVRFPGLQAFWFRRTFPELEQSVLRQLARFGYAGSLGARYNEGKHELRFGNGSIATFAHAKNLQEASALLSAEINLLVIDERTTFPPDVIDLIYSRVRSGVPGVPCLGVRSGTNPGEIGHSRVLSEYIDATDRGEKEITDGYGRRRIFIQSRVTDTPQLGGEYLRSLAGLPEKLRRAYLDGDWTVFAGQCFSEWRYDRHVVQPFTLPAGWQRYTGTDWGYAKPWCNIWAAVDEDGRVWFYRELYGPGVGEAAQAQQILAAEAEGEHVSARYADDAMWATRGDAKPIAAVYAEEGVYLTPAGKGPGSRVTRVQRTRTYLKDGPACPHHRAMGWEKCPMMHAFPACANLIRTLPALPHARTGNPEDLDTDAEDHAYDAASYLLVNLGTGPEFLSPYEDKEGLGGQFEVLRPAGAFAVRPSDDDPWADEDEDERPVRGATQVSPFA